MLGCEEKFSIFDHFIGLCDNQSFQQLQSWLLFDQIAYR